MASLASFGFNAKNIAPAAPASFEPIPAGDYPAFIIESDITPLHNGSGNGLKLTFEVLDGPHKGRKVWETLCIVHTNPKTQQIAQEQLSAICHVVGIMEPQDTAELHLKPMTINVAIRPADGQYKAKNIIKGYKPLSGGGVASAAAPVVQAPVMQATAPAAASANRPAWAKAA